MQTIPKTTLIVNLYGGPGCGKSTVAASIYQDLKWLGIDCELVVEYCKTLVWEESMKKIDDQLYLFAKQLHGLKILDNKVKVVVTDSPILLSIVYGKEHGEKGGINKMSPTFEKLVWEEYEKFNNLNYFLQRSKTYDPNGRYQTEEHARIIDGYIHDTLVEGDVQFRTVVGTKENVAEIVNYIVNDLLIITDKIDSIQAVKMKLIQEQQYERAAMEHDAYRTMQETFNKKLGRTKKKLSY